MTSGSFVIAVAADYDDSYDTNNTCKVEKGYGIDDSDNVVCSGHQVEEDDHDCDDDWLRWACE